MVPEDPGDELRDLWQGPRAQEERMSLEQIRALAQKMERKIRWRNLREYAAGLVLIGLIAPSMWSDPSVLVRIGAGLTIVACLYVVHHLHAWGAARPMPAGMALATCLDFHREELVRQRDVLQSVWSWYLLPFVPGGALIFIGRAIERPERWRSLVVAAVVVAFVFLGVGWLNARAAKAVQRKIDDLESMR